jgi:RNA polymerase sigma-70 factor, ECF subfamily
MAHYRNPVNPSTEGVWRALASALRAFVARRVPEPGAREVVVQETFAQVQREIGGLREGERLGQWVYQVAKDRVADHHSKHRSSALLFDVAADPPPEDEEQVKRELASWIGPCVDVLPDTYREALLLSELQDLPQQEVAERLGLSLSSAKSRIQRGRQRLLELLEACCEQELAEA